ncbi:MAG: hypothetical protein ACPG5Z_11960 [Pseudoalteromonas sp.]|uniref:hypothetical protein n=1 Tax=Pseudoalteromonas sp. KS88 TaxID=2109918 RepID=UPI001080FA31|nr:hypothetical protein [Pseudoalteromonas sp. KS88]TGE81323.1 hypothetical protein C7Y70_13015 [Pseudoalteromonas sp. KS88]
MGFSNDELLFLSSLFKAQTPPRLPKDQTLTVQSDIPANIACLFQNANLTLLAEVGHYQLWFPLEFKVDSSGTFTPALSAPEVIDTKGNQRSWRWDNLNIKSEGYCIESISSTGIFLKPQGEHVAFNENQIMQFDLPNKKHITMSIEPVRQCKGGIAAKIIDIHEGKEQLRAYLFSVHKRQYANLYNAIPPS